MALVDVKSSNYLPGVYMEYTLNQVGANDKAANDEERKRNFEAKQLAKK
jgi:hypothetical protein